MKKDTYRNHKINKKTIKIVTIAIIVVMVVTTLTMAVAYI